MVTAGELLELPPTLTVEAAGALLGLSRSAAYRAVARGDLPTIRLGHRHRVSSHMLANMLGADVPLVRGDEHLASVLAPVQEKLSDVASAQDPLA